MEVVIEIVGYTFENCANIVHVLVGTIQLFS